MSVKFFKCRRDDLRVFISCPWQALVAMFPSLPPSFHLWCTDAHGLWGKKHTPDDALLLHMVFSGALHPMLCVRLGEHSSAESSRPRQSRLLCQPQGSIIDADPSTSRSERWPNQALCAQSPTFQLRVVQLSSGCGWCWAGLCTGAMHARL